MTVPVFGVVSSTGLELYYSYDSGTVSSTTVTDQWTTDGNADNISRGSLATTAGKFGDANNVSNTTTAQTPRVGTGDANIINASWMPGTSDYTLTFWSRQDSPSGNRLWGAGSRGNDANNDDGLQLYLIGSGVIEVAYHDPSIGSNTRDSFLTGAAAGTWDGSTWNHIALVRNGTDLDLWVNGSNVGGSTLSAGYDISVGTGTWFREAAFGPDATVGNAAVDDAAIFKRALSNAELAELWNGGTGQTVALAMVPEPSSAALLGLGGLALILRRRK